MSGGFKCEGLPALYVETQEETDMEEMSKKEDWPKLYESMRKGEWLVNYPKKNIGTGSGKTLKDVLEALVKTGITAAACGNLGLGNQANLKAVIADPLALHIAARSYWWGYTPEKAISYCRKYHPEDMPPQV